jgi:hypothetical protein
MNDGFALASARAPLRGVATPTVLVKDLLVTFGELRAVDRVSFSV